MTFDSGAAPQFFVDPIGTVCTIVADVEPTLTQRQIIDAIEDVDALLEEQGIEREDAEGESAAVETE